MSLENIKNYLLEHIGLDPESIGDSSIERAIIHRMDALKMDNYEDYFSIIKENKDEFEELIEEVVVPETWFFRNSIPFDALTQCIKKIREAENGSKRALKILSVPCSTGEEPYSIAITLLKSGIQEGSFHIDAVDISKKALIKAKRGIYGKHSFRETNGCIDDKYFQQTRAGYQILPEVKEHISFIKANLLKDNISPTPEYYDVIFCRNLLIYFNRNTQKNVLTKLNILMRPEGLLFVGHAETACINKEYFSNINIPRSFAYSKNVGSLHNHMRNTGRRSEENLRFIYDKLVEVTKKDIELAKNRKEKFSKVLKSSVVRNTSDDNSGWWKIEKLIEQGNLVDASFMCEKKINEIPEDAQGYYYLGLICSLEGNVGAADSLLKKAVYLDPNHHKALGLLALLAEQRGENNVAESLRFREIRAKNRTH